MSRADLIAARVGDLPALPQVAAKVLELVQDPDSSTADLEKVISRDPAITAKLLKISNSALYGLRCNVSTVSQAIVILGFSTLRSVVLAASTEALFRSKNSRFKEKILWEHALAVALAARALARECRLPRTEEAFVAGLIHDIGCAILDGSANERYDEVVQLVYNDGMPLLDAERQILGLDHTEVGAVVAKRWNLAPALEESVRLHHHPEAARVDRAMCAIVQMADSVCIKLGIGPEKARDLDLTALPSFSMLPVDADLVARVEAAVPQRLAEEKELFGVS